MHNKQRGQILVVDDTPSWQKLLVEILQDDGHQVFAANNFQKAIGLLKTKHFDIALIDMRLVDKSEFNIQGMGVLKEAKELQPSIKAIILTGYPDNEQKAKAIDFYRADGFWEKAPDGRPFDIDKFSQLIFQLLQK